jgi:phosphatidylserine/phosphatidylglycerophosphate/cardiolipin synthase-like enzyme
VLRRPPVALVVLALVVLALVAPSSPVVASSGGDGDLDGGTAADAAIVAVYPNPIADGDAGEFVVVQVGRAPLVLSDGETTVDLATVPAGARVALSPDPETARRRTDVPVHPAPGLALSNAGERLRLRHGNRTVDAVAYEDAPAGERWVRTGPAADRGTGRGPPGAWRPLGFTPRPVRSFGSACATAFVLPDAPAVPVETVRRADRRILLAGYTFASERVTELLVAAVRRGVRVRVLLDDDPVGGITAVQARLLDRLVAGGATVRVLGGDRAAFSFHHAKYAVVDGRALVLTENWKPAGTGGADSRGWGVRLRDPAVAAELAGLFRTDFDRRGTTNWTAHRTGRRFAAATTANGSYPSRFAPAGVPVRWVRVLTAPGNAGAAVRAVVRDADERVAVVQPTLGGPDGPFARALLAAARRGVRVRVLLSSAWYVVEENRRLADALTGRADRTDLPLTVRLADPGGRYGKVHAKGLVADDVVVLGSLNWNRHSARENREVAVVLAGDRVAGYYREVFAADWRGGPGEVPLPAAGVLALAVALAVGVAIAVARRRITVRPSDPDRPRE